MNHSNVTQCANCGMTGRGSMQLLRCSRCRKEWFCNVKCQKSYWPFHRDLCHKNEFADALEGSEPSLAMWMRNHGKLAVLKDDEIERLEKAGKSASSMVSRQEVLESMYGRMEPKPVAPSYTLEQRLAMEERMSKERRMAFSLSSHDKAWEEISIPAYLGLECSRYKWRQTMSHVEVFVKVPHSLSERKIDVQVGSDNSLLAKLGDDINIKGQLLRPVQENVWFISDGVLQIILLKRSRKGHYGEGEHNASTWWASLFTNAGPLERICLQNPPTSYFWAEYDEDNITDN